MENKLSGDWGNLTINRPQRASTAESGQGSCKTLQNKANLGSPWASIDPRWKNWDSYIFTSTYVTRLAKTMWYGKHDGCRREDFSGGAPGVLCVFTRGQPAPTGNLRNSTGKGLPLCPSWASASEAQLRFARSWIAPGHSCKIISFPQDSCRLIDICKIS